MHVFLPHSTSLVQHEVKKIDHLSDLFVKDSMTKKCNNSNFFKEEEFKHRKVPTIDSPGYSIRPFLQASKFLLTILADTLYAHKKSIELRRFKR